MRNRPRNHPKLHNSALSQIVYVSKYTREALCCIPSLGFELEALFILQNLSIMFLNKKKATNVLSFPNEKFFKGKENFLGEIFRNSPSSIKHMYYFLIFFYF